MLFNLIAGYFRRPGCGLSLTRFPRLQGRLIGGYRGSFLITTSERRDEGERRNT